MTSPDTLDYDRAADRIGHILEALAVLGALVAAVWRGWATGAGFLFGGILARLNYRWLRRTVDGLGVGEGKGPHGIVMGLRYLILGGAAYAIVRYSSISLLSVFAGVLTLAAAVMIEIVVQIVYARK